ncbi:NCS1 allantoin transporter (NCS1 nucleoside transporter) [Colletotrichum plurivorum]|uniref:NCS1 allantoin transporter (NCS1 nucleoside transporter) n=1 Tax=Colletotrichum plurivorum TaxID=2175906 RepID=A0A8H6N9D5_9PEZI|nr:NCS1 allantoin transporter (NCS1 nucleoside transporter) [Colletotrichum plurivorum]
MARFSMPSRAEMAAPFQSGETFKDWIKAPEAPEGQTRIGDSRWSNKDLEPTPPEQRTWTWYNLPLYWFSNMFGTTGWNVASSLVAVGLTWQQAFISCILGALISAFIVTGMARPGVMYHLGYPVLARSVMGMYGSYFFVFIRAIVCIIWYGIQTYYGANLLSVCFRCVFGSSWHNFANALPEGADVTSKQLLAFFIVWLVEFPFTWVHPTHIHYIFTIKGFIMPFACFGLFGWCMANGAGISNMDAASAAGAAVAERTPLGWAVMSGVNVIMGSLSPMLVNQPDLARYCRHPRDAGWLQGACVFFAKVLVFFLGLASTTSLQGKWGEAYWNLWDLLDAILDHYWTPAARAGVFFVSFSFIFSMFATNFGANSIPFGADMTGLFPKYLTIRRGQIICAILGIVVLPWKLIANASAFLSFLGSYNIFMAPLCAIIIFDYIVARKGNVHVPSLYKGSKEGLYWFKSGINWVGVCAWIGGTALGLPGLVGQYQPQSVGQVAKNMYMMGWVLTFSTSAIIYVGLIQVFKVKVFPAGCEDAPMEFEWLAKEGRDGFFEGEREGEIYAPASLQGEEVQASEKAQKMDA